MSKCTGTSKEWDTCRVEKMGCHGCHYNDYDGCPPVCKICEKNTAVICNDCYNKILVHENIRREYGIMKNFLVKNGLWNQFLNDDEFIKYLEED